MNAAKKIRKLITSGEAPEQIQVLQDLARALEFEHRFELTRLYSVDQRYFELAVELLQDWRFDQHLNARNKLTAVLEGLAEGNAVSEPAATPEKSTKAKSTPRRRKTPNVVS